VAIFSSLVLATSFGFLYDHAGRNANTDALFALLVLLTVVTLWAAHDSPRRLAWLGPLAAATFLLRGMGVLMPLAIVFIVQVVRRADWRHRWLPLMVAGVLFIVPVGAWAWARWQLDQWRFLGPLFTYDFFARSVNVIEGHRGTMFYHLNVLQKNQTVWLAAGIASWLLYPISWPRLRNLMTFWRGDNAVRLVFGAWVAVTLLMPTLIRTKLSWYLNPFYPAFALALAVLFNGGYTHVNAAAGSRRRTVLTALIVLTVGIAETRLLWYSIHRRNLARSTQGFLLAERQRLEGHRVFRDHWDNSEVFVLDALVRAEPREAGSVDEFIQASGADDYWLARSELTHSGLTLVRSQSRQWLYRRTERRQ
jgi:4-amino-4-deoxy-L-arabinose transferase-like glycosyltransferase